MGPKIEVRNISDIMGLKIGVRHINDIMEIKIGVRHINNITQSTPLPIPLYLIMTIIGFFVVYTRIRSYRINLDRHRREKNSPWG